MIRYKYKNYFYCTCLFFIDNTFFREACD